MGSVSGGRLLIPVVSLWHVWVGVLLILDDAAGNATALSGLVSMTGSPDVVGAALITAGLVAVFPTAMGFLGLDRWTLRDHPLTPVLIFPQQFFLLSHAGMAIQAIIEQQFADGVPRPFAFIGADQSLIVLVAFAHLWLVIHYYCSYQVEATVKWAKRLVSAPLTSLRSLR